MTVTKSATVTAGTSPTWQVSATGFVTQSGTVADIAENTTLPIYLLGAATGAKFVDCGSQLTGYILSNGDFYMCGINDYYQQGNNSTSNVTTFTKRGSNVIKAICNNDNYCTAYLDSSGDLYAAGSTSFSLFGDPQKKTFQKVASNVKDFQISNSGMRQGYVTTSGDLYLCGFNSSGQQGSGDTTTVVNPTKRGENIIDYSITGSNTYYLNTSKELWACGGNQYNAFGMSGQKLTFTKIADNVVKFSVGYEALGYIDTNGDFYVAGYNSNGQLGGGNTSNVTTFTKRAGNVKDILLSGNYITCYLTNDGDLYSTGANTHGQQGDGTTTDVTTFTKRAENVVEFGCRGGTGSMWYITSSGDFYSTGYNEYGQQGSGDTTDVLTFTKRGENVKKAYISINVSAYIKNNGDLYMCGLGYSQGSGSSTNVLTFTKRAENVVDFINKGTSWYINENADLYGCGSNSKGQQGSGGTSSDILTFTKRVTGTANTANLTITPTPASATVTINGSATSSADIRKGMPAEWSVSKTGYVSQTGTIDHIYDDTTLTITLESE